MESSSVAIPQAMQRLVGSRSAEQEVTPSTTMVRSAVPQRKSGRESRCKFLIPASVDLVATRTSIVFLKVGGPNDRQ